MEQQADGELYKHLCCQKKYRKRGGKYDYRGIIPGRKSIDERPGVVEQHQHLGDREGDLMIGKNHQSTALTLVERKSRFTLIRKVVAIRRSLRLKPSSTIIAKNSLSIKWFQLLLAAKVYFAHPYSSCDRGTNENTNGLIRQFAQRS